MPQKFYKNCIKSMENARFSCKTPKIWRYFCAFLLLDKRQFDRPTMVDYAGISIKSTVRINKFQFAVLCRLHKKSRNLGPDPTLHRIWLCLLLPAADASADRNSLRRDHMQIFSWQLSPQHSYSRFPKTKPRAP